MRDERYDEWVSKFASRNHDFFNAMEYYLRANISGIEFLRGLFEENPKRLSIGKKYLVVLGNIANYCIDLDALVGSLNNSFSGHCGLPRTEVHPKGKWIRSPVTACIQSMAENDIPGTDSISCLAMGLLDDVGTYKVENQRDFRRAINSTYGFFTSSASTAIGEWSKESFDADFDPTRARFTIRGTHGFNWFLDIDDPQCASMRISSSCRNGRERVHSLDTWDDFGDRRDVERFLAFLSGCPRKLLEEERCSEMQERFRLSVAGYCAPLARKIEEERGGAA